MAACYGEGNFSEHIASMIPNSEYHVLETGEQFSMPEFGELEEVVFG